MASNGTSSTHCRHPRSDGLSSEVARTSSDQTSAEIHPDLDTIPFGYTDANAILRPLEGKALPPLYDAPTVCSSSWPDPACVSGVATEEDRAVSKSLRQQALQAHVEGLDVLSSKATPSQRKQCSTGRKGGPVGVLYAWMLRKEDHSDDGRMYIGRTVRSGLAEEVFKDPHGHITPSVVPRCLSHIFEGAR